MDRNIIAIHRAYADHEEVAAAACYDAAQRAGHTEEHADQCDDGSHACPACPFSKPNQVKQ
jgi:hypothetical protein